MPAYLVHNAHEPEECAALQRQWRTAGSDPLREAAVFCTCAAGVHAAYWIVEAADPDTLLASLPPAVRSGSRVHAGDLLTPL